MNVSEIDPTKAWQAFEPSLERPWSNRLAAHLHRRAGFGESIRQIAASQQSGFETTLDQIFDFGLAETYEQEMATSGRMVTSGPDANSLAAWWLLRMAKSPCPLQEKMTLFWHGHFATGADKVADSRAMLRQNRLLREHCLEDFEPLVAKLSRDVAMLIYLDSTENRKTRPNENYARELMELFCLGPGNYTEFDIKEIARCFTGWEVRNKKFKFNAYQHDDGEKSFLGTNGNFDGDAAIAVILKQPAAATFIAKKLIRFFVFDDSPISDSLAEPIAAELRRSNFNMRSTVRKILSSQIFYSELAIGKKIKSPVELAIGTLRFFDASVNLQQLGRRLERLGQLPLYPPNVKGWEGGRTWINAATILARANLVDEMLSSNETRYEAGGLPQWITTNNKFGVKENTSWLGDYLLAVSLPEPALESFQLHFKQNPAIGFSLLAALPEFQLN